MDTNKRAFVYVDCRYNSVKPLLFVRANLLYKVGDETPCNCMENNHSGITYFCS